MNLSTLHSEPDTDIGRFFGQSHRRRFATGATIITAGEQSHSLYHLVAGSVSILIEDDDGHEMILAYLNAGDFFGEIGLFDERHERSAWVRARSNCEVAILSYERLREVTVECPELIFVMLSRLSLRLRDTSRKLGDLAFKDVAGRVAHALLDLCAQPDAVARPGGTEVKVTRQELGRLVGCSREMASRVLRGFEERRLVRTHGRKILIFGADRPTGSALELL